MPLEQCLPPSFQSHVKYRFIFGGKKKRLPKKYFFSLDSRSKTHASLILEYVIGNAEVAGLFLGDP